MGSRRSKKSKTAKPKSVTVTTPPESTTTSTMSTEPATKPDPVPTPTPPPTEDPAHFDVLDHVYEGAKSAWAFGKGVVVFAPFMGLAETVAVKAVSIVTGLDSLEAVDQSILPHLKGIDKDFVDPAILKIWSLISPVVGKSEDIAKTMVAMVHKKPKIESSSEPEKEEMVKESTEVTAPEISTPVAAA